MLQADPGATMNSQYFHGFMLGFTSNCLPASLLGARNTRKSVSRLSEQTGLPSRQTGLPSRSAGLGFDLHPNPSPSPNKPVGAGASPFGKPKSEVSFPAEAPVLRVLGLCDATDAAHARLESFSLIWPTFDYKPEAPAVRLPLVNVLPLRALAGRGMRIHIGTRDQKSFYRHGCAADPSERNLTKKRTTTSFPGQYTL
ncbi:hypothetical protein DFH08DRAFT_820622 [Mycena albidolilacea]|uniref:Uncharacterized protein n=1 Tax=Mycena albidolilacea TaxID=1033008 RepID=A0AAD6ZBT2_9AGAR|nr:hypothetical protein DFH08DRAFT_820622 [Mycena albidolilacea]